jgi:broad specificity phosphatase PhoE
MPTVYLIRHGQASFGTADYDVLSPMGERQSAVLGAELRRRDLRIDEVRSGTLRRQLATAGFAVPGVPVREDARWNEYDHLELVQESLAGPPPSPREFQGLLEKALLAWMGEEGSTWPEFRDGACAALEELFAALGSGGTGLAFTSGGVISAICTVLLGLPADGFLAVNRTMVNTSLTKIVHGRSGTSLISLNEHGHLSGELLSYR